MARVKDWLIDMECAVGDAIDKGLTDPKEILMFVRKQIGNADETYVRNLILQHGDFDQYYFQCE